jgi:hypothetical protein
MGSFPERATSPEQALSDPFFVKLLRSPLGEQIDEWIKDDTVKLVWLGIFAPTTAAF